MKAAITRSITMIAALAILVGCASNAGLRIGNSLTLCCPGNYASYSTYAVESVELPIFLRDYMVEEFETAFQERGMTRNDQRSDIIVNFAYRHVSLDPEQQNIDPFVRMESINVELHYIAIMDITMRERSGGKEIWGGQISRLHSVQPGEYMHEDGARPAFLQTFRDLLSNYPSRYEE
ncbi:MAG: hypothetical protein A3H44_06035 [Gammaproteobacteria bacterium RIFCSPLOWO2_02_FULL_57_10]|nr:MAG: hypothetical protein A3H44_06035 [Gammaproteobacteria bacterium RIFCSPLOWO2_02_FULL_57_10]